ncbi:hypothetical protein [Microcystis aeruginosa]|uniref:hypothetical protein n=1 Tax=Microcystis aeruginosa TaxID=1126 RepID=UPI0011B6D384|nr:hypothetical protein [Microcystis aeruginosa]
MGARDAPLRVFGGGWAHAMRPYGFLGEFGGNLGYLGAGDAPLRVFGGLGARNAPLRVFGGGLGYLGAPEGEKPPHQVNLDTFREKIFLYRESLQ